MGKEAKTTADQGGVAERDGERESWLVCKRRERREEEEQEAWKRVCKIWVRDREKAERERERERKMRRKTRRRAVRKQHAFDCRKSDKLGRRTPRPGP